MQVREDEITVTEYHRMRDEDVPHLLLDIRPHFEHEIAHIGGTVIPMTELANRLADLEAHRSEPIVVYCRTGSRSEMVVQYLRRVGYLTALNLVGGMHAWADAFDPSMVKY